MQTARDKNKYLKLPRDFNNISNLIKFTIELIKIKNKKIIIKITSLFLRISICFFLKILNKIKIVTKVTATLMAALLRIIIKGKQNTIRKGIFSRKKVLICLFIIYLYNTHNVSNAKLK